MPAEVPSVFVRGLPFTTTEAQLSEHFSDLAPVKRAIIVRDKTTHESRGFGFVQLWVLFLWLRYDIGWAARQM